MEGELMQIKLTKPGVDDDDLATIARLTAPPARRA
jgi:hypothetical protein